MTTTPNLPTVSIADEVIVNRSGNTAKMPAGSFSQQLAASPEVAQALNAARAEILAAVEPLVEEAAGAPAAAVAAVAPLVERAEAAAAASNTAAKFADSIADGRALVADGETFGVRPDSEGGTEGFTRPTLFRRDSDSTQALIGDMPQGAEVDGNRSAIEAEVAARRNLVRPGAERSMSIRDAAGWVLGRISDHGLSILGRWRIGTAGDGLRLLDGARRVLLRVDQDGIFFKGARVVDMSAMPAWLTGELRERGSVYLPQSPPLPRWRRARAEALIGRARTRILCVGDSNTMGWNAIGEGGHRRWASYPDALAQALPAGLRARSDAYWGGGNVPDWSDYDPHLVLGSGWDDNGGDGLGGGAFRNSTTTAALAYTPAQPWQQADIWVRRPGSATLSVGIAGSLEEEVLTSGGLLKISYTAPTLAVQTLQMARVSGAVEVMGWDLYDPAEPGVGVINAGRAGWRSDQSAANAGDFASLSPDLVVIQLGINDFRANAAPEDYRASMATLIDAAIAAGADVVLVVSFHPSGAQTYLWSDYVARVYSLADEYHLPVVDLTHRYGSHAAGIAAGWVQDGSHLTAAGYAEAGWLAAKPLTL